MSTEDKGLSARLLAELVWLEGKIREHHSAVEKDVEVPFDEDVCELDVLEEDEDISVELDEYEEDLDPETGKVAVTELDVEGEDSAPQNSIRAKAPKLPSSVQQKKHGN